MAFDNTIKQKRFQAIRDSLTAEWQTCMQISDKCGVRHGHVGRYLVKLVEHRQAEEKFQLRLGRSGWDGLYRVRSDPAPSNAELNAD